MVFGKRKTTVTTTEAAQKAAEEPPPPPPLEPRQVAAAIERALDGGGGGSGEHPFSGDSSDAPELDDEEPLPVTLPSSAGIQPKAASVSDAELIAALGSLGIGGVDEDDHFENNTVQPAPLTLDYPETLPELEFSGEDDPLWQLPHDGADSGNLRGVFDDEDQVEDPPSSLVGDSSNPVSHKITHCGIEPPDYVTPRENYFPI